jgi:hypothetical protein
VTSLGHAIFYILVLTHGFTVHVVVMKCRLLNSNTVVRRIIFNNINKCNPTLNDIEEVES